MQEQVSTLLGPLPPDLLSMTLRAFAVAAQPQVGSPQPPPPPPSQTLRQEEDSERREQAPLEEER